MDKIIWVDEYSVGHKTLDIQHKELIELINKLYEYRNESIDSETINDIITELLKFQNHHLEYEEELLKSLGYPGYKEHKASHAEYTKTISGYTIEAIIKKNIRPIDYLKFIKHWLFDHILVEDMKFKPFLQSKLNMPD